MLRLPNSVRCSLRSLAGEHSRTLHAAAFERRDIRSTFIRYEVRNTFKQRAIVRRYGFCANERTSERAGNSIARRAPVVANCILASLLLLAPSLPARAQVVTPISPPPESPWYSFDPFDPFPFTWRAAREGEALPPEDTPVKTRQWPGYESVGVRFGPWMFDPSATAGAQYDSNVFASPTDPQGDLAWIVQPSLGVTSLWERHALDIQGSVRSKTFQENSGLNQTDANLRVRGRVDLWRDAALLTNFRVARLHEGVGSLTSPAGAVEPTPYDYTSADVAYWQRIGRFAGSVGLRSDYYNYGTTRAADGSIINQDSRDGRIDVAHGRLDYALTGKVGVFTAFEANRRNLRGSPSGSLSSDGYRSLSGFNFELGSLIHGEVGAGYASQRFEGPRIGTIAGPAYRAAFTWSPTRMLDLHLKAEQIVTEAGDTAVGGIRADAIQLGADYELRRNLVLSVAGTYERDKFFGQSRVDDVFSTLTALKYKINRHSEVTLQHQYFQRDSSIPTSSYDKHRIELNVTARY